MDTTAGEELLKRYLGTARHARRSDIRRAIGVSGPALNALLAAHCTIVDGGYELAAHDPGRPALAHAVHALPLQPSGGSGDLGTHDYAATAALAPPEGAATAAADTRDVDDGYRNGGAGLRCDGGVGPRGYGGGAAPTAIPVPDTAWLTRPAPTYRAAGGDERELVAALVAAAGEEMPLLPTPRPGDVAAHARCLRLWRQLHERRVWNQSLLAAAKALPVRYTSLLTHLCGVDAALLANMDALCRSTAHMRGP